MGNQERQATERNSLANIVHFSMTYAKLYLTIARIARSFNVDLYEITLEDVEISHPVSGLSEEGQGAREGAWRSPG